MTTIIKNIKIIPKSEDCQYSIIENKLHILSKNQEILDEKLNHITQLLKTLLSQQNKYYTQYILDDYKP